jgi:hypothetical protein
MACDIFAHVEIKRNARWLHWNEAILARDYALFGRLAGVRDASVQPVAEPRGFPADASELTKLCFDRTGHGAHAASWLLAEEAGLVQQWFENRFIEGLAATPLWGTVLGNPIDAHLKWKSVSDTYAALGIEDVRVVFWFEG